MQQEERWPTDIYGRIECADRHPRQMHRGNGRRQDRRGDRGTWRRRVADRRVDAVGGHPGTVLMVVTVAAARSRRRGLRGMGVAAVVRCRRRAARFRQQARLPGEEQEDDHEPDEGTTTNRHRAGA